MIMMIANIIINIVTIVDYDSNDVQTASLVVCLIRLQLGCFSALIVSLLLQSLKFALELINRMITLLITLMIMWTMAMIKSICYLFLLHNNNTFCNWKKNQHHLRSSRNFDWRQFCLSWFYKVRLVSVFPVATFVLLQLLHNTRWGYMHWNFLIVKYIFIFLPFTPDLFAGAWYSRAIPLISSGNEACKKFLYLSWLFFIFVMFFIFATPLTSGGNEACKTFFIFVLIDFFYICVDF